MNVRKLMQQAQKMQEQMERDLAQLEVGASVGGGMVQVKMNGHKQLLQVTIDSDAIDDDTSMLEDLVLVAVNEAARKVDEEMQSKMGGLAGVLGGALPGL